MPKPASRFGPVCNTRSSSQKRPSLHAHRDPPLIHLPLVLPEKTASTMTPWLEFNMNLSALLPLFQSLPRGQTAPDRRDGLGARSKKRRRVADLPTGQFAYVSYVRVYANCRLRRIWLVSHRISFSLRAAERVMAASTSHLLIVSVRRRGPNTEHSRKRCPRGVGLACCQGL